jgi:hypothetical protein
MQNVKPALFLTLSLLALALFFSGRGNVSTSTLAGTPVNPTPAYAPTMVQLSPVPSAITPTPLSYPTDIPTDGPTGGPPLSLTLTLLFTCCALGLVLGVLAIGLFISMQKRKEEKEEKGS